MKNKAFVKASSILIIAAIIATAFSSCALGRTRIVLSDYVEVTYTSFNGYSSPSLSVAYDDLADEIDSEKYDEYVNEVLPGLAREYGMFGESVLLSEVVNIKLAEDYKNLSNGDKIKVIVALTSRVEDEDETLKSLQKGLGIKFDKTEIEFTVEGLEEAKALDIVTEISQYVSFSGADGYAHAELSLPSDYSKTIEGFSFIKDKYQDSLGVVYDNDSIGSVSFSLPEDGNLKKGDTVSFKIALDGGLQNALSKKGYLIPNTETVITVPDLGTYVNTLDELSDADIASIKAAAMSNFGESHSKAVLLGTFFGSLKETSVVSCNSKGCVTFVFKVPDYLWTSYYEITVTDIIRKTDGTLNDDFDIKSKGSFHPDSDDTIVEELDDMYTYVTVE